MRTLQSWAGMILCFVVGVCLAGCGASSSLGGGGTTQPTDALSGNWLFTGSLPVVGTGAGSSNFTMAATFTETNGVITPTAMMSYRCTTSPTAYSYNISFPAGTVGSNGGFTLSSPTTNLLGQTQYGMTLSAPSSTTSPADFTATLTTLDPNPSYCSFPQGQTLTATKLADYTGTYMGTVGVTGSSGSTNATVTLGLQQGVTNSSTGKFSMSAMSGTITVVASGCSLTGTTMTSSTTSIADGAEAQLSFKMSDGGTWNLNFSPLDSTGAQLNEYPLRTSGGSCGVNGLTTTVFTRQ